MRFRKKVIVTGGYNNTVNDKYYKLHCEEDKMAKCMILQMHPAPYRDEILYKVSNNEELNIEIISIFPETRNHKEWVYRPKKMNVYNLKKQIRLPFVGIVHVDILYKLIKENYDVLVINGYGTATNWIVILFALITGKPYIYSADTVKENSKHGRLMKKILDIVYTRAKSFWIPGKASKDYFVRKGIEAERIFEGCYTYDFTNIKNMNTHEVRTRTRQKLSLNDNDFLFLFVGKLVPNRRISLLIDAMKDRVIKNRDIKLLIIGDGEEEKIVIDELIKNNNIIHIKRVSLDDLNDYFMSADAYIHPGEEPYSLAIVQAVAFGLPVISSYKVGAVYDYVTNGVNGILLEDVDSEKLRKSMIFLTKSKFEHCDIEDHKTIALSSRNVDWAAEELFNAIKLALLDDKK